MGKLDQRKLSSADSLAPQFIPMKTHLSIRWTISIALLVIGAIGSLSTGNCSVLAQQTTRVWSDDSGSFSTEAGLLSINPSSVTLQKPNGVVIEVPFVRLSKFDMEFVEMLQKKQQTSNAEALVKPKNQAKSSELGPRSKDSKLDDLVTSLETPTAAIDSANPSADQDTKPLLPPVKKDSIEISYQELKALPEPYQTTAWKIIDIKKRDAVREGLMALASDWPEQEMPTIVKLIRNLAKSADARTRKRVIDLLAQHDAKDSLAYIIAGTEDPTSLVRWASYEWIEKLGDRRAIFSLVKKLESDDPNQAVATLLSFGTVVETHVLPLLNHESEQVQMTTCSILAKIGSPKSISKLQAIVNQPSSVKTKMQARNAIDKIKRREHPDE